VRGFFYFFPEANYQANAFFSSSPTAQRTYAETVLLNLSVKDQKIQHFQFKPAYQLLADLPENASIEEVYTWADAFKTFDWEKALPVPDVAVKQIEQLLALV
jgi:hypothetical protein